MNSEKSKDLHVQQSPPDGVPAIALGWPLLSTPQRCPGFEIQQSGFFKSEVVKEAGCVWGRVGGDEDGGSGGGGIKLIVSVHCI